MIIVIKFCSLDNKNCLSKPNSVLYYLYQKDPNEDFTIKAHRPGPTTSVPQTGIASTAPSLKEYFAVEIQKEEQQPKAAVKRFRLKSLKSKLRPNIKKYLQKAQPKTATDSSTISSSQPSDPHPSLTITVPETQQDQQPSLESPSERLKRVASLAINNLGRAFSSCLPKTPPCSPVDQTPCILKDPSNIKTNPLLLVKSCLGSRKFKGKNWKDALMSNSKNEAPQNSNIFSSAPALDDMMDKMIDAINNATGRKTKHQGPKLIKRLWKRTRTWAAGF